MSYLDNLLENLSKKEVRSGHSLADVDPGGVPTGGYSKIPTKCPSSEFYGDQFGFRNGGSGSISVSV